LKISFCSTQDPSLINKERVKYYQQRLLDGYQPIVFCISVADPQLPYFANKNTSSLVGMLNYSLIN
jgi:hypothetical protein